MIILKLALTDGSIHCWILSAPIFIYFPLLSTFSNWNATVRKSFLSSTISLFPYYVSIDSWIFILFCGLKFNTIVTQFVAQIVPAVAGGSSCRLAPVCL